MLLRLNRLVQTVGITASRHDTSGKFIYDQDLIILYHIVLVTGHQVVGTQGQDDIVLDLQVFRIRQVFNLEKPFHLGNTLLCKVYHLILLVDYEVAAFFLFHAHDRVQLGQIFHIRAAFHLFGKDITGLIKPGGFPALSGNNQGRSCLINQYGVNLIDDGIMQVTKHKLLLINDHVIS